MFFLALECSTSRGSIALGRDQLDGSGSRRWEFVAGRGQGGQLFRALEEAVSEIRAARGPLTEIVVGLGPGSYSGVRQAVAAAVGLAEATGARLSGVPSVVGLPLRDRRYQVVGDARRGAFYYSAVQSGVCVVGPELLEGVAALERRLAEHSDWSVRVVEASLPGALLPDADIDFPEASLLFRAPDDTRHAPPLAPIYLRPVSVTLPKPVRSAVP